MTALEASALTESALKAGVINEEKVEALIIEAASRGLATISISLMEIDGWARAHAAQILMDDMQSKGFACKRSKSTANGYGSSYDNIRISWHLHD